MIGETSGVAKTVSPPNTGNALLMMSGLKQFELDQLALELKDPSAKHRLGRVDDAIRTDLLYPEDADTQELRAIMGLNFIGRREMAMLTNQMGDPVMARKPLYPKALVLAHKDDHLLICFPRMSGEELEKYVGPLMAPNQDLAGILAKDGGYGVYNGWKLIRKTPIPGSAKKTAEQQISMKDGLRYATPSLTQTLFVMATVHKLNQGQMFAKQFVRVGLNHRDDEFYAVGWPTPAGIEVRQFWADDRKNNLFATGFFHEPSR